VRLFDHVGNYERHGLPDDSRDWTLDGIDQSARERVAPIKRCPACFGVASAARKACPYCHAVYSVKERTVTQVAGELEEIQALRQEMPALARACHSLRDFQALAKRLDYKPGWAWMAWERAKQHRRRENQRIWDLAQDATEEAEEW
jgi:hypothetical protein